MSVAVLFRAHAFCWLACYSWEKGTATEYLQQRHNGEANWSVYTFVCVCVRTHMSENPQPPLFPASHRKGLFGFIVQEGLCTQLAHLYKFSLYGALWNGRTRSPHCMTLPCVHTTRPFNPALVRLHGQAHAYIRACRWLDRAVSVGLSIVMKKRIHHCFNVMSL